MFVKGNFSLVHWRLSQVFCRWVGHHVIFHEARYSLSFFLIISKLKWSDFFISFCRTEKTVWKILVNKDL